MATPASVAVLFSVHRRWCRRRRRQARRRTRHKPLSPEPLQPRMVQTQSFRAPGGTAAEQASPDERQQSKAEGERNEAVLEDCAQAQSGRNYRPGQGDDQVSDRPATAQIQVKAGEAREPAIREPVRGAPSGGARGHRLADRAAAGKSARASTSTSRA